MNARTWFEEMEETAPGVASPMALSLQSTVERIESSPEEQARRQALLDHLSLYVGRRLANLYQLYANDYESAYSADRSIFNVTYSVINTIRSRICSFRPRAQFIPAGGNHKARRVARDLTAMSDAWADEVNYQREASFAFRDLLTGDAGVLKVYRDGKKIKASRFPSWEFLCDPAESIYGEPECFYHRSYLPLDVACAKFDVEDSALTGAVVGSPQGIHYTTDRRLVRLVEAWHRGPKGRHVVICGHHVVADEPWGYEGFPVVIRVFDENPVGMWGSSAIAPIAGLQRELALTQERFQEGHANATGLAWILGTGDTTTKITNSHTTILREMNPGSIRTINPPPLHSEAYQYLTVLKEMVYDTLGVSQFIAAGTKQPGLNSAVAIRESSELQSDRLSGLSQVWEGMRTEVATWWRDLTRDLAKDGVKPTWKGIDRGAWKEFVYPSDAQNYEIRAFPSSVFGQTVSGRLDKAMEAAEAGWISQEDAMKAIDVPDLSPILDLRMAEQYAMEALVDDILEEGEYQTPDEVIDPAKLHAYARSRYLLATVDGAKYPPEHMAKLRRLLDYASDMIAKVAAKAAPATPPPAPVDPNTAPIDPAAMTGVDPSQLPA